MSERTVIDVSQVVEQQKLGGFLVGLVVISWIITFFDGFDSQAIAFAAPYLSNQYHLDRIMMGNIFSMGLVGALIGGFGFGYLGDRIGRRPAIILATAAFGLLTLAFVFADSYASLLALRLIDGIALGGMLPLSWALNIEYVPKRYRSTVVTVIMIGYSVGIAVGGPAAISTASLRASSLSLSAFTTRLTTPSASASAASIVLPVKHSSLALFSPTTRVKR